MDGENTKKAHRKKKKARVILLALCLAAASGLAGCNISPRTAVLTENPVLPEEEVQKSETNEKELEFRQRFYLASPDNLQLVTMEELKDWENSGKPEKELQEGKTGWGMVLAEFPGEQITMYGYLDEEMPFQGVIIRCGDSVSYFPELVYLSDSYQMPDAVSDSSGSLLTVSFHAGTGEKRDRDLLCVFLKSESGTMTADFFTEEDYLSQMANRFSLSFKKGESEGTLLRQDGKDLGKADLSWARDAEITGLKVSERVHFKPGNPAQLEAEVGITAEGKKPCYGDGLTVTAPIEILVRAYENGSRGVEFLIGEVEQKTEQESEKSET